MAFAKIRGCSIYIYIVEIICRYIIEGAMSMATVRVDFKFPIINMRVNDAYLAIFMIRIINLQAKVRANAVLFDGVLWNDLIKIFNHPCMSTS